MRNITLVILSLISSSCFAFAPVNIAPTNGCNIVDPWPSTDDTTFSNQFEDIAYCQCANSTQMPYNYCKNQLGMGVIYKSLINKYGNLTRACIYAATVERRISKEICIKQWEKYLALHPM